LILLTCRRSSASTYSALVVGSHRRPCSGRDVELVTGTEGGQGRHLPLAGIEGLVGLRGIGRGGTVDHFQFARLGKMMRSRMWPTISSNSTCTGMRYFSAKLKARTVSVKISCTELGTRRWPHDHRGCPTCLHDVRLPGAGRHAGGRAATHDVDDHAGTSAMQA